MKTTLERMKDYLGSREAYAAGHDSTDFIFRELDEIRAMAAKALGQIGMLGLPEPPAEGVHGHKKVFSRAVLATYPAKRQWICSECLEEGTDSDRVERSGPTYDDLLSKKRGRGG